MSLLTQASLVLTPTAYKANKLYSVVPSSGSGDLTTTRATTATRVNSSGLVENVATSIPRIDYTDGIANILLEPQRTNLKLQSSNFTTSWDSNNGGTVTSNTTISPDGTQNADTINPSEINGSGIYQNTTVVVGNTYTFSVYVKDISTATSILIGADNNLTGSSVIFNPTTGTIVFNGIGIISSSVVNAGNGWYRVIGTYIATTTLSPFVIYSVAPDLTGTFAVWGAQLETGSYATSYIPTTTSTVTRNVDLASVSGVSNLIGQTEGTLYIECSTLSLGVSSMGVDENSGIINISDDIDSNRVLLYLDLNGNYPHFTIFLEKDNELKYFSPGIVLTNTNFSKIAVVYKPNAIYLFVNGIKIYNNNASTVTFPSGTNFTNLNLLILPKPTQGLKVKSTQIYKTALTDAECISLTTL